MTRTSWQYSLNVVVILCCLLLPFLQSSAEDKDLPPARYLPLPGIVFSIEGHTAWLITPATQTQTKPWVFFAHTLAGGNPRAEHTKLFKKLIDAGVAIAGIDVGESYGSPAGRALFTGLYRELVEKRSFAKRPCLFAQSRGGLQIYNWAVEHPEWVAAIAGVFPVADLTRYPGLKQAHKAYGLTVQELTREIMHHNPIDRLEPLADAHVPILHIHGTNDTLVPLKYHTAVLAKRYKELGGEMRVIEVPGLGHTLSPEYFENPELIDFILKASIGGR